jgi:hypothetical protein
VQFSDEAHDAMHDVQKTVKIELADAAKVLENCQI